MSSEEEEEEDYLTMALPPTSPPKNPTSLAKRTAATLTASERGRVKSKRELEHERLLRLEKGLRTDQLGNSSTGADGDDWGEAKSKSKSKGAAMMARLGYTGGALGKRKASHTETGAEGGVGQGGKVAKTGQDEEDEDTRLTEPIRVQIKANKHGIGHGGEEDPAMKRAREALDREEERVKMLRSEMGGYRERNVKEGTEKRVEGQWWGAMRVCRTLAEQDAEREGKNGIEGVRPREVDVSWRMVLYQDLEDGREREKMREKKRRLERDDEVDVDDKVAMGETVESLPGLGEEEDPEEDEEMQDLLALSAEGKLMKTVLHLREKWWYCFWCKSRYDDKELDGCPGVTEEDHE
ncbi:hypothetical protein C1H76_4590 [Elsinoe australis]|uniref:DUF4187 domain-containing protein n=1 Tax=Elsinoe australis TaxID=40998 RepID=A0A4U7B345_9PEZI|nr:hypothetical protein C1H76_4590 [Elsinoe australis]